MRDKPKLRVGLIGTGFMGKAHVFGFASAQKVFDLPYRIDLHTVADITPEAAERAAADFGFDHSTADWRDLVANPEIDLIDITAPNALHKEMALAAIAAGKHVYCEKPLAPLAADAREMAEAAAAKGVKTQVGFNYLCNPMMRLARDMIAAGELGKFAVIAACTPKTIWRTPGEFYLQARSRRRWRPCRYRQPCAGDGRVSARPDQ